MGEFRPAERVRTALATLIVAGGAAGCGSGVPPPRANPPPAVDRQQVEQMLARMMGRAAPSNQPAAAPSNTVQVVVGTGHTEPLAALAVSSDGRHVLSASYDETVKLWDVAAGQETRTIPSASPAPARALGFNADATRMLVGYAESTRVIDTASGAEIARLDGGSSTPLAMTSDGRVAVVQLEAGPAVVDASTGKVLWPLPGGKDLQVLALSDDGATLLVKASAVARPAAQAGPIIGFEVQVWSLAARNSKRRFPVQRRSGFDGRMALSPDGSVAVVEVGDGTLQLYDAARGTLSATLATGAAARPWSTTTLAFSPDGHALAWASIDDVARLWRMPEHTPLVALQATVVRFSADGRSLVVGRAAGGAPVLRDLASGRESPIASGASEVADLSPVAGGRGAATAAGPAGVKIWDLATGQLSATIACPDAASARSVSASPSGPIVAIGCADGSVLLADLAGPGPARTLRGASGQHAFVDVLVRFSADGRRLVSVVKDELAVWDGASGAPLQRLTLPPAPPAPPVPFAATGGTTATPPAQPPGPSQGAASQAELMMSPDRIHALAVRADGAMAAIGRANELAVWDLSAGRLVGRLAPPAAGTPGAPGMPGAGAGLGAFFGGGGARSGPAGATAAPVNPHDLFQSMNPQRNGATALAFSADGRTLIASGSYGYRLWDMASGHQFGPPPAPANAGGAAATEPFDPMALLGQLEIAQSLAVAYSPDGHLAARAFGQTIRLFDPATGAQYAELSGHTSAVTALAFCADGRRLLSGGRDGSLRVWSIAQRREQVALYSVGRQDFVDVTPEQYYRISRNQLRGVAFRLNDQVYPFEQFDLRFNRPDRVIERLGIASEALVLGYRRAYEKRLKKMGFSESALGETLHLPKIELLTRELPVTTGAADISVRVRASDEQVALDRIHLYVNDVPVHGSAGLPVAGDVRLVETDLDVPLVAGRNKIQVSVLNRKGAESLRQTLYTTSSLDRGPGEVWVVAIGVSQYRNPRYALRFAAKDAADLSQAFRQLGARPGRPRTVHVLQITDQTATRTAIRAAKQWLAQAQRQDLAVVFAAGHGLTDDSQNYFYGTWDIDADAPSAAGLPFEDFEDLLDGIAPMRKVLLVDTCFSGEIDKDEVRTVASAADGTRVTMREYKAARNIVSLAGPASASTASSEPIEALALQQELFADLRRGTGAVVISSSSGNEYSLEGEQWSNGVFTYAVLQALAGGRADRDGDGVVTVSELQAYVIDEVRRLTKGAQNPTVRRENLDYDFEVY